MDIHVPLDSERLFRIVDALDDCYAFYEEHELVWPEPLDYLYDKVQSADGRRRQYEAEREERD